MRNLLLLTALLGLLAWSGCKKPCEDPTDPECVNYCFDPTDPDCDGYDPCWDAQVVKADFEMAEVMGEFYIDNPLYVPTDTSLANKFVRFRALQEADEYEWRIGGHPEIFDEREVQLRFRYPTELFVTLIIRREPRLDCLPDDDGVDTFSKRLVIVPIQETAIIGKYEGATKQNPDERYVIEIFKRMNYEDSTVFSEISITGVHPECNNTLRYNVITTEPGYRALFMPDQYGSELSTMCSVQSGFALLSSNRDSLTVAFHRYLSFQTVETEAFEFRGKRIE